MTTPRARILADWAAGLRWADMPPEQRGLAGLRTLDTVGLVLAGSTAPAAAMALATVARQGASGKAGILPSGSRAAPAWAAFAHGVMAHCRDFDDTFPDSVVHPGSVVVPAALAAGEARRADAADIAAAIAAGYETAARIGAVAGRRFHLRGLHATGIVGPFAAAAAAGRIFGLDGERMASAFGLAGSMSAGLMAFLNDGSWSKWLHAGWAAHGGIVAAELAAEGFRGPAGVLDARFNLFDALLADGDLDRSPLTAGLGTEWRGAGARFKRYPCAHVIHPYIDAAVGLAEDIDAARVAEVRCRIAPWAVPIVAEPRAAKLRPDTELAAIASLPYMVAVALAGRRVTLDALDAETRQDPALLDLCRRVTHVADPALGDGFDGVLAVTLDDGQTIERPAVPAPPDRDRLLAKYRANAARALAAGDAATLERAATAAGLPDFAELFRLVSALRPA